VPLNVEVWGCRPEIPFSAPRWLLLAGQAGGLCSQHANITLVESRALPRARTFRNREKAVAFAKELAKKTPHEVRVRIVGASYAFDNQVLYIFNKGGGSSPSPK
jgi:hypothetical protein